MIQDILNRYSLQSAREVQFRLGHRTVFKKNREWIEADQEGLGLSEWEDLKDLCLRADEKIFLETKGYIRGIYTDHKNSWIFSFVEWKENLKAYFSLVTKASGIQLIQNPAYWDALKNKSGIHIISGFKQSGKSTLVSEIITESKQNSVQQIIVHADPSVLTQQLDEMVFQVGPETIQWDANHPFYDGADIIVVDLNDFSNIKKWIQFSEEGKKVFITALSSDVTNTLMQIKSVLSLEPALWARFVEQLSSVLSQKIIGDAEGAVQEILVFKKNQKQMLIHLEFNLPSTCFEQNHYQSANQSIIQALVRRRFDVKTAFSISNNPDELDQMLKKMGL
jgi:twitching motility protein PilT